MRATRRALDEGLAVDSLASFRRLILGDACLEVKSAGPSDISEVPSFRQDRSVRLSDGGVKAIP